MRDALSGAWRDSLSWTLVASLCLHLGFMGFVLTRPPEPKLSPAMASERVARFVIARFPTPPKPKAELERREPKPVVAVASKPKPKRRPKRTVAKPTPLKKPPPPALAKRVEPPKPKPPASVLPTPPKPAVITSKPTAGEPADIVVAEVSATATEDGPEGPLVVAVATVAEDVKGPVAASVLDGAAPGPDVEGLRRGYIGRLNKYFRRVRRYPRRARRAGIEGTVLLEVVLDAAGRIVEIRVARSSGHPILDDAARESVLALGTVPCPPGELKWRSQAVRIPFEYSLRS